MTKSICSAQQKKLQRLVRQVRLAAGFSQQQLAQRLGKPQSFVSKYEQGERRLDVIELGQICNVVGISLQDFVERLELS